MLIKIEPIEPIEVPGPHPDTIVIPEEMVILVAPIDLQHIIEVEFLEEQAELLHLGLQCTGGQAQIEVDLTVDLEVPLEEVIVLVEAAPVEAIVPAEVVPVEVIAPEEAAVAIEVQAEVDLPEADVLLEVDDLQEVAVHQADAATNQFII